MTDLLPPLSRGARLLLLAVWGLLVVEAALVAPPVRDDVGPWVLRLLTGEWSGEEPLVVALFQLMGVWPMVLAAALAPRLARRPVPLWPFALGSFALGAFALLPGLGLGGRATAPDRFRGLRHPAVRVGLGGVAVVLAGWALGAGDPARFAEVWRGEQFVHVMTLDFFALWLTSVVVAREEGGPWAWALVPLVGTLVWMGHRRGMRP